MEKRNAVITLIHRINRLKQKAGADPNDPRSGFIDTQAIKKAQRVIDDCSVQYASEVKSVLGNLDTSWQQIQAKPPGQVTKRDLNKLSNDAHQIKDISLTYKYSLMAYFAESLEKFSKGMDVSNNAHRIIVKAHMDVMAIAAKSNIREQGNPVAEELKQILVKAIAKHGGQSKA